MPSDKPHVERGKLLYQQNRYAQALTELAQVRPSDEQYLEAMLYKAHVLSQLNRHQEALTVADELLHELPDVAQVLALKGDILHQLGREDEALTFIEEAIRQDPSDDDFWASASAIYFDKKQFDKALDMAGEGLRLDPTNSVCLNMRALSLTKLNRPDEAANAISDTLAENPDDAYSHAASGWALLEAGNHKQARTHFAEALRRAPGMTWAEGGMLEAIKAKNPVYRLFTGYYFWLGKQTNQNQWLFIVGTYFVLRWLRGIENPNVIIQIAKVGLISFFWLGWFVEPVFNVLMLGDKDGRHLLSDRQRDRYRYVAALLGLGVPLALAGYVLGGSWMTYLFIPGAILLGLALPLSAWIEVDKPKNRKRMRLIFSIMAITGAGTLLLLPFNMPIAILLSVFGVELLGFMILRNFLLINEND